MNKNLILAINQAISEQNYTRWSQLTKEYVKIVI